MKPFKDTGGAEWAVEINVDTLKRLRGHGIDLLEIVEEKSTLLQRLRSDPVLLVDTLYLVCKPQADGRNVTDEQFGRAMAGDAVDDATSALLEELADFFPSGRRKILRDILEKMKAVDEKATALAAARMQDPRVDAAIEKMLSDRGAAIDSQLDKMLGDSSGGSPDSSASTPGPSPSAS